MNEFLEAVNSEEDESSEDRYEKMKKEEAGTSERDPAKQRYQEIKEKAKKEMMKDKQESDEESYEESQAFDEEEAEEESFITY